MSKTTKKSLERDARSYFPDDLQRQKRYVEMSLDMQNMSSGDIFMFRMLQIFKSYEQKEGKQIYDEDFIDSGSMNFKSFIAKHGIGDIYEPVCDE